MEELLGGHTNSARFGAFLADWQAMLQRRTEEAVRVIAAVDGVSGLILAGGVGRGRPWPLSDIDLLPIYDDDRIDQARQEVEQRRMALMAPWLAEGWWSGVDIGKLAFIRGEVAQVLSGEQVDLAAILADDRWYHSLDKGYQSRAALDPDGAAEALASWFTAYRFDPEVVRLRLLRGRGEVETALNALRSDLDRGDLLAATTALRTAIRWFQAWLLEQWGERDASLARVGTRFEEIACTCGLAELVETLHVLGDLDRASVESRMTVAPAWVWERHDRSWRARRHIGEPISREQDARDVLRVCTLYGARYVAAPPYPAWLAIPGGADTLLGRAETLTRLLTAASPP